MAIFEPGSRVPGGRGALGIRETVAERLHLVPRYRQKIHPVRFHLGHPVWVDDPDFDLDFHVRYESLASSDGATFRASVARILARPLDMRRPLWDMTIVTGLAGDRVAVVNRAHHAMVDGVSAADIITVLLDLAPEGTPVEPPAEPWTAKAAPTQWELVKPVLWNPPRRAETPRAPRSGAGWASGASRWAALHRLPGASFDPALTCSSIASSVFSAVGGGIKVPLAEMKAMKDRFGCTVNDAVLGLIAEGCTAGFGPAAPACPRAFASSAP